MSWVRTKEYADRCRDGRAVSAPPPAGHVGDHGLFTVLVDQPELARRSRTRDRSSSMQVRRVMDSSHVRAEDSRLKDFRERKARRYVSWARSSADSGRQVCAKGPHLLAAEAMNSLIAPWSPRHAALAETSQVRP